jgi:hypothetical protein
MENHKSAISNHESTPPRAIRVGVFVLVPFFLLTFLAGCGSPSPDPLTGATVSAAQGGDSAIAPAAPAVLPPHAVGNGDTEALAGEVARLQGRVKTQIDLSFTAVSDNDLAHLELPDTVHSINLSGTKITDQGIEHLRRARNLEELILIDTQVTESVLEILKQMPNLTEVRLDNTPVPVASQLEMVRFLTPRAQARTQQKVQAAAQQR